MNSAGFVPSGTQGWTCSSAVAVSPLSMSLLGVSKARFVVQGKGRSFVVTVSAKSKFPE